MNNQFRVDKNPSRSGISASDGSADSLDSLSPANLASIVDIELRLTKQGLELGVLGSTLHIRYPRNIWETLGDDIRWSIAEHIAVAATQSLPLMRGNGHLAYSNARPLFYSLLQRFEMHDLLKCEAADHVEHLEYLRQFWNQKVSFGPPRDRPSNESVHTTPSSSRAILPFSFGKESLATLGICRELGIAPILVYCEEPSQPYELGRKRILMEQLRREFGLEVATIESSVGKVRHGGLLDFEHPTELGWGLQTTMLSLLSIPFAVAHESSMILVGNEASCNSYSNQNGWHSNPLFEQASSSVEEVGSMIKIISGGRAHLYSSLEPLEQIAIFYLLHSRYPDLAKFQFSCEPLKPLQPDSNWCCDCYKCERSFLYASALGFSTEQLGFKRDLLNEPGRFENYFNRLPKMGPREEMDLAFSLLLRRNVSSPYIQRFKAEMQRDVKPFEALVNKYTSVATDMTLPPVHKNPMLGVFKKVTEEMRELLLR